MSLDINGEIAAMRAATGTQLRRKYEAVFGESARSGNKGWLIRRIAWRLQANEEGDLPARARRRAEELANDADLRQKAPRPKPAPSLPTSAAEEPSRDDRIPMPSTEITRRYKGRDIVVHVLPAGFGYLGATYQSLSAVARAVTGAHANGLLFFRIGRYAEGRK